MVFSLEPIADPTIQLDTTAYMGVLKQGGGMVPPESMGASTFGADQLQELARIILPDAGRYILAVPVVGTPAGDYRAGLQVERLTATERERIVLPLAATDAWLAPGIRKYLFLALFAGILLFAGMTLFQL
jgi:hypothetical protein